MDAICPKCLYHRTFIDTGPVGRCPRCGSSYPGFDLLTRRQKAGYYGAGAIVGLVVGFLVSKGWDLWAGLVMGSVVFFAIRFVLPHLPGASGGRTRGRRSEMDDVDTDDGAESSSPDFSGAGGESSGGGASGTWDSSNSGSSGHRGGTDGHS